MSGSTRLQIDCSVRDGVALVRPTGVLDLTTYADLRDTLIKCALDEPRAVVVDVGTLWVPTEATLAVFSAVWMRVSDWPGVPIVLVVPDPKNRQRLGRRAIARFVPVHATLAEALQQIGDPPPRRRGVLELPCSSNSPAAARRFVAGTCERWNCVELLPDAVVVASELVENAVRHAHSEPRLRLDLRRGMLTVAVYDNDPTPAQPVAPVGLASRHLGLELVDRLASTWSCAPTWSGGKVVWAVLSPLDRDRTTTPGSAHAE
jgi:anti-sigma regulatory factor (Ser/Thr protein kinase)